MNKPILFNTEMVKAILEGRKTVTRRICKSLTHNYPMRAYKEETPEQWLSRWNYKPPYQTGDILWVRETWCFGSETTEILFNQELNACDFLYKADYKFSDKNAVKWHPSLHMPREAARIFLRVTDVRAERLQEISNKDALREGVARHGLYNEECYSGGCYNGDFASSCSECEVPRKGFSKLWNSTVKDLDSYGWDANPYVWVISFERCEKPEGEVIKQQTLFDKP